jgi:AcrR family transcriptional regulator
MGEAANGKLAFRLSCAARGAGMICDVVATLARKPTKTMTGTKLTFNNQMTSTRAKHQTKAATRLTVGTKRASTARRTDSAGLEPRKQPRQERATATVAAILEAAACILESRGLEGYTTNAIAERAGASIGSIYQYFPNKTSLTRALIAREDATLLEELLELLDGSEGLGLLRQLIRVAVVHQLRRPVLARLLDAEEAHLPPSHEASHLDAALASIFVRCLRSEAAAHDLSTRHDLFSIIHGMVDGAGQRNERDVEGLVTRVERAVFGYLAADVP